MIGVVGENEPWMRDGWTLPPRCCGEFAHDRHSCVVCGNAVSIGPNIVLSDN